jgi:hypothetical protein
MGTLINHIPPPHHHLPFRDTATLPGYQESEETDSSLNEVLDSLIPYLRDHSSTIPLPVYLGKSLYKKFATRWCNQHLSTCCFGHRKEYAWSRGLGIEYSPIKTRSARKKAFPPLPNYLLLFLLPWTVGHLER